MYKQQKHFVACYFQKLFPFLLKGSIKTSKNLLDRRRDRGTRMWRRRKDLVLM